MNKDQRIRHVFVDEIPEHLDDATLYVSTRHTTVLHLCMCGCGNEVVTPLAPTDWRLVFDGESLSLDPSIGNWALPCRSHYWIDRGVVHWARGFSEAQIESVRALDRRLKEQYYSTPVLPEPQQTGMPSRRGRWARFWLRIRRAV